MPKNLLTLSRFPSSSFYAVNAAGEIILTENYSTVKKSNWLYFIIGNCGQALRANATWGACEWVGRNGQLIESDYTLHYILFEKFTAWKVLEVTKEEFDKFAGSEYNKVITG